MVKSFVVLGGLSDDLWCIKGDFNAVIGKRGISYDAWLQWSFSLRQHKSFI